MTFRFSAKGLYKTRYFINVTFRFSEGQCNETFFHGRFKGLVQCEVPRACAGLVLMAVPLRPRGSLSTGEMISNDGNMCEYKDGQPV